MGNTPVSSKPVAELQKMSVSELRSMLEERGVSSKGKTEKSELAEWVWQHQHLPALRKQSRHDQSGDRRRTGYGPGEGRAKDAKRDRLKGNELVSSDEVDDANEEAEAQKLLSEGSPPKPETSSIVWKVLGAAALVTTGGLAGAIALTRQR